MDAFALTPAERTLFRALHDRGVRFLIVGLGLEPFETEYAGSVEREVDGIPVRVLPLRRVIVSKRATNRPKDRAALPALEATLAARALKQDDE